ncbi:hypothetical protein JXQ70_07555 [bacterium]|nr:hypothetical protein [bacterium]
MNKKPDIYNPTYVRSLPQRRQIVLKLLADYTQPVALSDFVNKHVRKLGLANSTQGRHNATVYINRMVALNEVMKVSKGKNPLIVLSEPNPGQSRDTLKELEINMELVRRLNPATRRQKILDILKQQSGKIALSEFMRTHCSELGFSKEKKQLTTLRAFLYRMAEKGQIIMEKGKKYQYLSLPSTPGKRDNSTSYPSHSDQPSRIQEMKTMPQSEQEHTIPLSLETLIEARNKLMAEMEQLDQQLEEIVEKKKELKIKRDQFLNQIRDLF